MFVFLAPDGVENNLNKRCGFYDDLHIQIENLSQEIFTKNCLKFKKLLFNNLKDLF